MTMVTPNATTSPVNAIQTVNNLTAINGIPLMAVSFLVVIWLVVFFRAKNVEGTRTAIAAASFLTAIISILFGVLGLIPDQVLFTCIGLGVIGVIPLFTNR